MEERKRGRIGFIVLVVFLLLLISALAVAALFALTPKRANPLEAADTGIGFESLVGGENSWMDGGLKANLLAVAISRGKSADADIFSEELAVLNLLSDNSPVKVTLLRDPVTKELAFLDHNGLTLTHNQRYLRFLLEDAPLGPVFCKSSPAPITVMGRELDAVSFDYRGVSLFGEPLRFTKSAADDASEWPLSLTIEDRAVEIAGLPAAARVTVKEAEDEAQTVVFSGVVSGIRTFDPESHTPYQFVIDAADADGNTAQYRFMATFKFRPTFSISHNDLLTGGSFVIRVSGARQSDEITAEFSMGYSPVFSYLEGVYSALVPISHVTKAGEYDLRVACGDYEESFVIRVTEDEYEVQHLEITGDGAAANTADANREYADTMYPLFESFDPLIYWEGPFVQPVSGTVTTPYGVYRYTNNSTTATRHAGIDIANAEGTDIVAPNHGKVIYSGFLTLSGNTILIEHGMGLHTLYMHMEERAVEEGDFVEKAQKIGTIGTTGYSTGPHLHYQMMIRDYSINPWYAQDGRAGFFAAE